MSITAGRFQQLVRELCREHVHATNIIRTTGTVDVTVDGKAMRDKFSRFMADLEDEAWSQAPGDDGAGE